MHIGQVIKVDTANGPGIRLSVFVSGCRVHCKECFNQVTWDFEYGKVYDSQLEDVLLEELGKEYYEGITILGGEPFEEENQRDLVSLLRRVKTELPEKTIWMYTGYLYDRDLIPGGRKYTEYTDEILDRIDVLVDGPFMADLRNIQLAFRGSENQRLLDMKKIRGSVQE